MATTSAATIATTIAAAALLQMPAGAHAECGEALDPRLRRRIAADTSVDTNASTNPVVLVFAPRPAPPVVGRHFALDVVVCGGADLMAVDAEMPAHRHGMNYRTSVQPAGDDRYLVQGLMFHMPGRWRYQFTLRSAGQRLLLTHDVEVR